MKNNIKQIREDLGISQEKLAEMVGISVAELSDIECNESCPSLVTAHDIVLALDKQFIADVFLFEE